MQRMGMVLGLKADKIDEYVRLHAAVWPDVLAMISGCKSRMGSCRQDNKDYAGARELPPLTAPPNQTSIDDLRVGDRAELVQRQTGHGAVQHARIKK